MGLYKRSCWVKQTLEEPPDWVALLLLSYGKEGVAGFGYAAEAAGDSI